MIARIRKSMEEKDQGFTLIELLVVMIIIGILAAIAIPIFMNQREKAVDSAAVSDVSTLGKEIATFYVDAPADAEVTASVSGGRYMVGAEGATVDVGAVSSSLGSSPVPAVSFGVGAGTTNATSWCVQLTYDGGTNDVVSYSAASGLNKTGGC
jgi:prepilin-type N-terminal cleavage/methylation domain-containing protein